MKTKTTNHSTHSTQDPIQIPPANKNPVYLDFGLLKNAYTDNLGTRYQNYSCINTDQDQINTNIRQKIFDYTQKYQMSQRRPLINLDAAYSGKDQQQWPDQDDRPPFQALSFWGINESSANSVKTMSDAYLGMKQKQELTQLQQNAHAYPGLLEDVKTKQAKELQIRLQAETPGLSASQATTSIAEAKQKEYTSLCSYQPETTCLDAQGQWDQHNPRQYPTKSKYDAYKKMSPDDYNRLMNKPIGQSIQPNQNDEDEQLDLEQGLGLSAYNGPNSLSVITATLDRNKPLTPEQQQREMIQAYATGRGTFCAAGQKVPMEVWAANYAAQINKSSFHQATLQCQLEDRYRQIKGTGNR